MSYEGRRNNSEFNGNEASPMDEKQLKKQQEQQASAKALKTAAKGAATYFAGPLGGKAVDAISKTKAGQQILNKGGQALNKMPGMGKAAKQLDDSGITDTADKAVDMMGGKGGTPSPGGAANTPGATPNTPNVTGGVSSTPASNGIGAPAQSNQQQEGGLNSLKSGGGSKGFSSSFDDSSNSSDEYSDEGNGSGGGKSLTKFTGKLTLEQKIIVMAVLPTLAGILFITLIIGSLTGGVGEFGDAFGAAQASGGDTGGLAYTASSKEAQEFYERINEVKLDYQSQGKTVDVLKVAAVYHVMNSNNKKYDHDYMTKNRIEEIADAMFMGNSYNEETFRTNLTNDIFRKYFPLKSKKVREQYTEDVFDYIENYYSLIGKNNNICAASGTCVYNIKGFRINGNRITKQLDINNLMVRLMECGSPYGAGNYNTPIDQPMVSFEDYAAGVAYAEVGPSAHMEVLKAQMVMARSFALARPTAMGNSAGKKLEQENGQWVLQIASCVADQVFCNINEGCSYMGGGDGQGGIVRSGHVPGAQRTRDPLPENHNIRIALSETMGEVLLDNEGYVVSTSYTSTVQNKLSALASQGYNYKQMLLEVYNSVHKLDAADIQKMSCNTGSNASCGMVSTGPFATWKQYEGPWISVPMGDSGKTIKQIGCLATSVSILIAKSGVPTNIQGEFNPGTFVQFLNTNGGFASGGNFVWASATKAAPSFVYQGQLPVSGYSRNQKLNKIKELLNAGYYVVAEVKGNTGQHWVAIDAVQGDSIVMMDPGSPGTDMWATYPWNNTSTLAYFKVN